MQRSRSLALAALLVVAPGPLSADNPPPPADQGNAPEKVIQRALQRLITLEGTDNILRGVSRLKPDIERDQKGRVLRARFVFAVNAGYPASPPNASPGPKDDSQPFFWVSVSCWLGTASEQPLGEWRHFDWQGQGYTLWVQVYGSNADLVETVRQKIEERLLEYGSPGKSPPPDLPGK